MAPFQSLLPGAHLSAIGRLSVALLLLFCKGGLDFSLWSSRLLSPAQGLLHSPLIGFLVRSQVDTKTFPLVLANIDTDPRGLNSKYCGEVALNPGGKLGSPEQLDHPPGRDLHRPLKVSAEGSLAQTPSSHWTVSVRDPGREMHANVLGAYAPICQTVSIYY